VQNLEGRQVLLVAGGEDSTGGIITMLKEGGLEGRLDLVFALTAWLAVFLAGGVEVREIHVAAGWDEERRSPAGPPFPT
jgi:hypothetical protein